MKHQASKILATIFFLLLGISVSITQAQSPQDTLNQYISDLQKNPSDTALREKIIKLAREMNPPPAIPEEARRHYVKASTLFDDAKQPSDSADAAEEFRQALLVAPWWGEAYMKMGLALETAQRYDDAIASLKLFMATKPQDEVLRKTQDEIYKIEAKRDKTAKDQQEKAAKEAQAAQAAKEAAERNRRDEQRAAEEKKTGIEALAGNWRGLLPDMSGRRNSAGHKCFEIRGNELEVMEVPDTDVGARVTGVPIGEKQPYARLKLDGHRLIGHLYHFTKWHQEGDRTTWEVSDDFKELTERQPYDGQVFFIKYRRDD